MATQAFDWKTDRIDNRIVNPDIYTDLDALLADYATLRREDPVHWTAPDGFRPFWAITSMAMVRSGKFNRKANPNSTKPCSPYICR